LKKYKSFHFNSKTFKELFFSLLGIAFITFGLMALVVIRHAADSMKKEEIRIAENKIHTILEDIENQEKIMKDMAVKFASYPEFRLDKADKNYKRIEIAKILQDYNFVSGIAEHFFLKYKSDNSIYTSGGTTTRLKVFLADKLKIDAESELKSILESEELGKQEKTIVLREGECILFIFPLKTYITSREGTAEYLCVTSSTDVLSERIENFVGKLNGELAVYYDEVCIYGDESLTGKEIIEGSSIGGNIYAKLRLNTREYFSLRSLFSVKEAAVFFAIAIILIFLAIMVASWNFRPIRRIATRFEKEFDGPASDWGDIESMIDALLSMKEKEQEVMQECYRKLREQVVQLVASGEYSYKLENCMTLLNIRWNAPFFGLIRCDLPEQPMDIGREDEIRNGIEDLSGDGLYLYPYKNAGGEWNVLVAAEESYLLEETMELMQSVFEVIGLTMSMELIARGNNLKELKANEQTESKEEKNANKKESKIARQIVAYIKENCTDYNMSLELVAQEFQITTQYLCKIIKQQIGMSYKEYLTELRIAEAKRMLVEEELNVTEVCTRVGYTNVSNFIRVFQKYTGMTPAKFRDGSKE